LSAIQTDTATLVPAGTWTVDPVHSSIRWDVIDLDTAMKSIAGRFTDFEGTLEGGDDQRLAGVVRTTSLLTDHEQRDAHLRSQDMLDTDRFPEIRFASTEVEHVEGDRYRLRGELVIKEVPLEVELDAKLQGSGTDADGVEKTLFRVQGDIEWGPTRVEITADITAIRQ
jgi:polyisoprenoid-binding protein YceI